MRHLVLLRTYEHKPWIPEANPDHVSDSYWQESIFYTLRLKTKNQVQ